MQALELSDRIALEPARQLEIRGFAGDTLVRAALEGLARAAGVETAWSVTIEKQIPVAAGLGGGSADAATALLLADSTLAEPLGRERLHRLAAEIGADVPFFLGPSCALGRGDGTALAPLDLPHDYSILLVLPEGAVKSSTGEVYAAFDALDGARGFAERRAALERALAAIRAPADLAALPPNDLAGAPVADELRRLGAFRADVTGAGPVVYGLFEDPDAALQASRALAPGGRTWLTRPAWYV
jgi:4-diphosphocytidyl-2-C-methyl-D-erythritol kinase